MMPPPKQAVFLDRDGVIVKDFGYAFKKEDMHLLPGVPAALLDLKNAGFHLIVATNQSGIGRDLYTEADMHAFNEAMSQAIVEQGGAELDAIYYCPHHPSSADPGARFCDCRKPRPGMLLAGIEDFGLNPNLCYFIGDKPADVEAAIAAGIKGIQVTSTGYPLHVQPFSVQNDLPSAAKHILSLLSR